MAKTPSILSKKYILKWPSNVLLISVCIFGISSCEDPATQIGSQLLLPTDIVSTNFTDTLTVKMSTVLLDSVATSANDKLLVGRYIDPIFGTIEAKSYFQITNVDSIKANENSVLDSVVLNLGYKYYYGDTLKSQSFTVHRVFDKIGQNTGSLTKRLIESLDARNTYYNTDNLNYDPTPLGKTGEFKARPVIQKSLANAAFDSMYNTLAVKLNASFGKELMSLSGKKAGSGLVNFKEYFKGMVLVPGENDNAAVLGFEPTNSPATLSLKPSYIGLYYHTKDQKDTLRNYFFVSFTSNESYNNRFNSIKTDRTSTSLAGLKKPNDSIAPQFGNGEIYVQSSTGVAAKIEIPYLKQLAKDGNVAINKVELILNPIKLLGNSFPTIALNLIGVNPKDKTRPLRTATGELAGIPAEDGASAQLAIYNSTTKQYTFNITSYVQTILSGRISNDGFIISPSTDYRINRLIMDKNSVKLRVFYSKTGK